MYCIKCGEENPDEAKYCIKCGAEMCSIVDDVINQSLPNEDLNSSITEVNDADLSERQGGFNLLIGIITLVLGGIGFIYGFATMQSDKNPKSIWAGGYTSPLTDHEKGIIAIICISLAAIIAGIIMVYKSKQSK